MLIVPGNGIRLLGSVRWCLGPGSWSARLAERHGDLRAPRSLQQPSKCPGSLRGELYNGAYRSQDMRKELARHRLRGGSPVGTYRSDDTPGIYRSKGECRAYRANSVLYCTISHDAVRYYATPCYAIHTTLRRAYHAMPQCHTILHNVPPAPWCPARILRASSHAYGDSGSGSGSGVWHAGLAVPAATRREPRVPPDITRSLNPSLRA